MEDHFDHYDPANDIILRVKPVYLEQVFWIIFTLLFVLGYFISTIFADIDWEDNPIFNTFGSNHPCLYFDYAPSIYVFPMLWPFVFLVAATSWFLALLMVIQKRRKFSALGFCAYCVCFVLKVFAIGTFSLVFALNPDKDVKLHTMPFAIAILGIIIHIISQGLTLQHCHEITRWKLRLYWFTALLVTITGLIQVGKQIAILYHDADLSDPDPTRIHASIPFISYVLGMYCICLSLIKDESDYFTFRISITRPEREDPTIRHIRHTEDEGRKQRWIVDHLERFYFYLEHYAVSIVASACFFLLGIAYMPLSSCPPEGKNSYDFAAPISRFAAPFLHIFFLFIFNVRHLCKLFYEGIPKKNRFLRLMAYCSPVLLAFHCQMWYYRLHGYIVGWEQRLSICSLGMIIWICSLSLWFAYGNSVTGMLTCSSDGRFWERLWMYYMFFLLVIRMGHFFTLDFSVYYFGKSCDESIFWKVLNPITNVAAICICVYFIWFLPPKYEELEPLEDNQSKESVELSRKEPASKRDAAEYVPPEQLIGVVE